MIEGTPYAPPLFFSTGRGTTEFRWLQVGPPENRLLVMQSRSYVTEWATQTAAFPIHKHDWFRMGDMTSDEARCLYCGITKEKAA